MRRLLLAVLFAGACSPVAVTSATDPLLAYPSNPDHPANYGPSVTGVRFHNGVIMGGDTNLHLIFLGNLEQANKELLSDFATNLSGSPMANVLTTFGDGDGNRPSGHFNVDTRSIAASLLVNNPLTDDGMAKIVHDIDGDAVDQSGIFVFLAGTDVVVMSHDGPLCGDSGGTKGFHHAVTVGLLPARVAAISNPAVCRGPNKGCPGPGPNGICRDTDTQADLMWHEIAEAVSDPLPSSGYTPETGDLCEGTFGSDDANHLTPGFVQLDLDWTEDNGAAANVRLGMRDYKVQPIWQNVGGGGCARRLALQRPSVPLRNFAAGDINFDQIGDLLLHNSDTGNVLTRATVDAAGTLGPAQTVGNVGASAQIYGVADFNGDGIGDILWRNLNTGRLTIWLLGAGGTAPSFEISPSLPIEWAIKAVGDFDGNGFADILLQNLTDNSVRLWRNDGTLTPFFFLALPSVTPSITSLDNVDTVGAGDIDGDGKSDVLWHDLLTDSFRFWKFNGTSITSTTLPSSHFDRVLGMANIGGVAVLIAISGGDVVWVDRAGAAHIINPKLGSAWRYSGASKLAGQPTLLWRNRKSGDVRRWLLSAGGVWQSGQTVVTAEDPNRQIIAY